MEAAELQATVVKEQTQTVVLVVLVETEALLRLGAQSTVSVHT